MKAMFDNLGLRINPKKLVSLAKQVICICILVDVENNMLKIPDKMKEIKELCSQRLTKIWVTILVGEIIIYSSLRSTFKTFC